MNERLQQKIDEIKKNRKPEDFHPLLCFDAYPPKMEYDMPPDYQFRAKKLLEFIEQRDAAAAQMKNLSPSELFVVRATLNEMNRVLDDFEAKLEQSYLEYQKEGQLAQELYEATDLQDQMSEEHFIMVKHLKPQIFEKFKEYVFKHMTKEEIEEQLAIIARREAEELESILAADIQAPEFKNPHLKRLSPYDLFTREMNNLSMLTHHTDDFARELHAFINESHRTRFKLACRMNDSLPVLLRRLDETIRHIEPETRKAEDELKDYLDKNIDAGKFIKCENEEIDGEKANACFERLERYQIEVFIANKHLEPKMFPEYERIVTGFMSPEEKTEYYAQIAEVEEKSLKFILKAVANEIH